MKKLLGVALILFSAVLIGYSQDNSSTDDQYYNDESQPAQSTDQNYTDDDNSDNSAPTYQTFYDGLSPYGQWINYPGYGYCWVPNNLGPDFSPYATNGHWVYTDMGWTWVSDFPWGWGPFHYGRWLDDPSYGWMWVPGYDWAPAWVIWGDYGGYYGWACLGPRDVLSPHFRPDAGHWHFVEHQYMGREDFGAHVVRNDVVAHGIDINNHINIISNANTYHQSVFFGGPKPEEVEKYSGQKVQAVKINNVNSATQTKVSGGQVNMYRPGIARTTEQHAAPAKVTNAQPTQQRTTEQPRSNNTQQEQRPTATPPRQSTPRQAPAQQPQLQFSAPSQPVQQHTFVPSSRPSSSFSAPSHSSGGFSGGGGGSRGGGGGRR